MTKLIKGAIVLVSSAVVSTSGFLLSSSSVKGDVVLVGNSSLNETGEVFQSGSVGHSYPSLFLSATADINNASWDKKAKKYKNKKPSWSSGSFFSSITKANDPEFIEKVKEGCKNAYKEPSPTTPANGMFFMSDAKWREVWILCGKVSKYNGIIH